MYNNTNYTENMMIVLLDDETKQIHVNFQILIYFYSDILNLCISSFYDY